QLDPHFAEAHNGLGGALVALGRVGEAINSFSRAANIKPGYAEAHFNRGIGYLLLGDYERGWPGYEWRWGMRDFVLENIEIASWPEYEARWLAGQAVVPFPQPRWDGSPLAGHTILLYAEQGLGDTLQFIRYAPYVKQ